MASGKITAQPPPLICQASGTSGELRKIIVKMRSQHIKNDSQNLHKKTPPSDTN
jgi:hypothetical protein